MLRDANHRQYAEFIDRDKCVAYIIEHQFSKVAVKPIAQFDSPTESRRSTADEETVRLEQLEKLDDGDILKIYRAIKNEEAAHHRASYAAMEPFLFFNQPSADADFTYWLDIEAWTPQQAAALSMGKEPSVVNASSMKGPLRSSKIRLTYRNRSDAILSALASGHMTKPIKPKAFIEWALAKRWELPGTIIEWSAAPSYEDMHHKIAKIETLVEQLQNENKKLRVQSIENLDPRSTTSFCKVILGMAIARYEHKLRQNSRGPMNIRKDIEGIDCDELDISAETIGNILRYAADHLDITEVITAQPKWFPIKK